MNGDGYDDILIASKHDDENAVQAGQTYLILGKASGWARDTDLNSSDASFLGEYICDYSGCSVSGTGDVNNDGYDDILIGAMDSGDGCFDGGQTYLILGRATGWAMNTNLSTSDASFLGEEKYEWSGDPVAFAGDVSGDGLDDILICARNYESGHLQGSQVYLILMDDKSRSILYYEELSIRDGNQPSNYTFSIMYRNINGDEPVNISLVIDDDWYDMIRNDSVKNDFKNGVRYSYTLNLTEGIHLYYYSVSDGKNNVRFPLTEYLVLPKDLDGDGIPNSFDTDRDGDNVLNVFDDYPNDPTRWKNDTNSDPEDFFSISKWVGLAILVFLACVFGLTIFVNRKKRTEKSKESKTDDLGRVGNEE